MSSFIEIKNLSLVRNHQSILKNISLSIEKRDFVTIIGPNGAGKSMLLKALMGFFRITSGKIEKKKGLKIGYVPQRLTPDPTLPLKVKDFLTLKKNPHLFALEDLTRKTNIAHLLEKQLHVLSGGEFQRVLLCRALFNNPDLLILDEPAQNLDISGQLAFYKLIDEIYKQNNIAIIMVSHDLHLVMASSKKVVCLFHHICCSGEPQMVTKDPEFLSLFGEDMANMMAVYPHMHDHNHEKGKSNVDN